MKNKRQMDQYRRELYKTYEETRLVLKAISKDLKLPLEIRHEANLRLAELPRNSSRTRIRDRCILTGRGRGVVTKSKVSRQVFRRLASKGILSNMQRACW